jgi:hypothetical protein
MSGASIAGIGSGEQVSASDSPDRAGCVRKDIAKVQ